MIILMCACSCIIGYVIAKLTNPKDPVRDEMLAHAYAGNEVIYAVNREAVLLRLVSGKIAVYTGHLEMEVTNGNIVVPGFDH